MKSYFKEITNYHPQWSQHNFSSNSPRCLSPFSPRHTRSKRSCLELSVFEIQGAIQGARIYERYGWFIRWQIASITRPMLRRVPIERQDRSLPSQSFQLRLRFSVAAQHYRLSRRMERWKGPRDAFLPADPSSQRCILARVIYNFIVTEPGPREWLMIAAHEGEGFLAIFI